MRSKRETTPVNCERCGTPFQAEIAEVRRGHGRFCSMSCAKRTYGDAKRLANGNNVRPNTLCKRARQLWIERHGCMPTCEICQRQPADVHHKDGDRTNNAPDNHQALCRSHHVSHENHVKPRRARKVTTATYLVVVSEDAGIEPAAGITGDRFRDGVAPSLHPPHGSITQAQG